MLYICNNNQSTITKTIKIMSTGYQIQEQEEVHYVTFQIVKWIDIFTRQVYRDIFIDSLRYSQQYKRNEQYQIWTHENHAQIIYSNAFMDQKIKYIHENPVRAGINA